MTVTNQQLQAALETLAEAESDMLAAATPKLDAAIAALQAAQAEIQQTLGALPAVPGPALPGRAQLNTCVLQLETFIQQTQTMRTSINLTLAQYAATVPQP